MKAGVLCCLLCLLAAAGASGQESDVAGWLKDDPNATAYKDSQAAISRIFLEARQAGVPSQLLMDKLREGASKRVPPERLTAGLASEAARLKTAAGILQRQGVSEADAQEYQGFLRTLSIAQAAGIGAQTLESIFSAARSSRRASREAASACAVLIQMKSVSRLTDEDLRRLGDALLSSGQPSSAFKSIPSFYLKARAAGLGELEILDEVIVKTLKNGGGLVQMEEQMRTRRKGR